MNGKCQMCGVDCDLTMHHCIPQSRARNKYKKLVYEDSNIIAICRQCHDFLHSQWDESYLRDNMDTLEKIMANDEVKKFVTWRKKHPDFNGHAKMGNNQKVRKSR